MLLMGLDLSATAPAAVCVPTDWGGNWARAGAMRWSFPLTKHATDNERARRCLSIAYEVMLLAQRNGVREAWIESYAYGLRTAAHTLAEVGGVVRGHLDMAGMRLHTANMSSARKLLLGNVPRSDAKEACREALRAAGMPKDWSLDESDAFVAANWGLSQAGAFCFTQAPVEKKKGRKR
jgi:hypothetical protein